VSFALPTEEALENISSIANRQKKTENRKEMWPNLNIKKMKEFDEKWQILNKDDFPLKQNKFEFKKLYFLVKRLYKISNLNFLTL
jgi:hypothetical protein